MESSAFSARPSWMNPIMQIVELREETGERAAGLAGWQIIRSILPEAL